MDGRPESALTAFLIALGCFIPSFLWEIVRPLPLPILFNRRTREIYFEQEGQLYHSSWDGVAAAAYTFDTLGPYTGGMQHASLEVLLCRQGHPDEQVLVNLGSPLGKSLEMQLGFWEYLRAYMDNGPWFGEQGRPSESPAFNQSLLAVRQSKGQSVRLYWGDLSPKFRTMNSMRFPALGS